jgi:response regulator NasT
MMDSRGLTEPQAYAEIRKAAMNQGRKIVEIADAIVTAQKLLGEM